MNDARRKRMKALHTELTVEMPSLEAAHGEALKAINEYNKLLGEWNLKATDTLSGIRDEENDAYENMPESQQNGDKGAEMQSLIEDMDNSLEIISEQFEIEMPTDVPEEFGEFLDSLNELTER